MAYRDLHRHRRCHKFRQSYSGRVGFDTPTLNRHKTLGHRNVLYFVDPAQVCRRRTPFLKIRKC
jgi:hypothetical protein